MAKKFSAGAIRQATNPSMDDMKNLAANVNTAKRSLRSMPPGYQLRLEKNRKQPTGIEPVTGSDNATFPKASKRIARSPRPRGNAVTAKNKGM